MSQTKTKKQKFDDLIYRIGRQYPQNPSTFSPCECGERSARGADNCAYCLEVDLSVLLGTGNEELVIKFHDAVKTQHRLICEMMDMVKGK